MVSLKLDIKKRQFLFKKIYIFYNYSKYKLKCLLTKDPNETKSLDYVIITNYTVSWIYYADNCFCLLKDYHTLTELWKKIL